MVGWAVLKPPVAKLILAEVAGPETMELQLEVRAVATLCTVVAEVALVAVLLPEIQISPEGTVAGQAATVAAAGLAKIMGFIHLDLAARVAVLIPPELPAVILLAAAVAVVAERLMEELEEPEGEVK